MLPATARVAVLVNPANTANAQITLREVEAAGRAMGLQLQTFNASASREIDAAFAAFGRERPDAVFVGQDAFFNGRRLQLANWAVRHALPMTSGARSRSTTSRTIRSPAPRRWVRLVQSGSSANSCQRWRALAVAAAQPRA